MNQNLCPIWYTNPTSSSLELEWGFKVCTEWLVAWVERKATVEFIPSFSSDLEKNRFNNDFIPCINIQCQNMAQNHINNNGYIGEVVEHTLEHKEVYDFLLKADDSASIEKF